MRKFFPASFMESTASSEAIRRILSIAEAALGAEICVLELTQEFTDWRRNVSADIRYWSAELGSAVDLFIDKSEAKRIKLSESAGGEELPRAFFGRALAIVEVVPFRTTNGQVIGRFCIGHGSDKGSDGSSKELMINCGEALLNELRHEIYWARMHLERKMRDMILETLPSYVFLKDNKNNILYINRHAAEEIGKTQEELFGKNCEEIYPEMAAKYYADDLEVLDSQKPKIGIVEKHQAVNHRGRWVETDKFPIFNADGMADALLVLSTDITERRQMIEDLVEKTRALERSNYGIESLAFVAAHHLQEPLRIIITSVDLLLQKNANVLDSKSCEWMDRVLSNAMRMRNLLRDVILYLETQREALNLEAVSVPELVSRAVAGDMRLGANELEIVVQDIPLIHADVKKFYLVIKQLLLNSVQHGGRRPISVEVSGKQEGDSVVLWFVDNGRGVSSEFEDRVFELFQTLEPVDTLEGRGSEPNNGTGIGLPLCRDIVERHGGQLSFDVTKTGCSVKIVLPKMPH